MSSAAILAATAGGAQAFSEPRSYYDDPGEGGGGGRWFTSSPAEGYGCSVCHTGAPPPVLHIEGLPQDGYVPGASYDLRFSWPEFTARAQILAQTQTADAPGASMGFVAELVAETGFGSGTLEVAAVEAATPGEHCTFPPDERAAQLYSVKSGKPVEEQPTRCEAAALEERCIVAVADCGAQELRVRWTAPATLQRAIWFASGFVTTDASSDTPAGDSVMETRLALHPAGSGAEQYESDLTGGCSASGALRSASGWPASLAFAGMTAWMLRARRDRGQR